MRPGRCAGKRRKSRTASAQLGATEENFHSVQAAASPRKSPLPTRIFAFRKPASKFSAAPSARVRKPISLRTGAPNPVRRTPRNPARRSGEPRTGAGRDSAVEQSAAQARNLLARLAGQAPGGLDATLSGSAKSIPNPSSSLAIGIPADVIRQRPDLRVAGINCLPPPTRAAEAERFPSLGLSGSLGMNTLSAGKIFNPETTANLIAGLSGQFSTRGTSGQTSMRKMRSRNERFKTIDPPF